MPRTALILLFSVTSVSVPAMAEKRLISIGERAISVTCEGQGSPTVILIPAGGRTGKDWSPVQPALSAFTRACTYDLANQGESDKAPSKLQSVDEVVDDLHGWLQASGEKAPFVLVGHSASGFYARRFTTKYPLEVSGLVFVDSAHEEQALRLHELDPQGPTPDEVSAKIGFYVRPGEKLQWRTDVPLIVLARGKPFPRTARDGSDSQTNRMTEEQFAAWDRIWRENQKDLAARSTRGELRIAEQSGHWIQRDQPELVTHSVRDVLDRIRQAAH